MKHGPANPASTLNLVAIGLEEVTLGHDFMGAPINPKTPPKRRAHPLMRVLYLSISFWWALIDVRSDAFEEAQRLWLSGEYHECLDACQKELESNESFQEKWYLLGIDAAMALGQYGTANSILEDGLEDRRVSGIKLFPAGHPVALFNNQKDIAAEYLEKSVPYINSVRYSNVAPDSLVYLGRAALILEVDPRVVLEVFYDAGMKASPPLRDSFLAAADLALQKEDYAVAENTVKEALVHFPDDADLLFRWAQALGGSGNDQMGQVLNQALEANPNHIDSLLSLVDHSIDAEDYQQADEIVQRIHSINPHQPEAWAYKAVMAHLENDLNGEQAYRQKALEHYTDNPKVDHIIGKKLSQKYRFKEGALYQEASLKLSETYTPAQMQLAQDFLRLGKESEGWDMANAIHEKDGYNITAFNLMQLKSVIEGFTTLESEDFILRMESHEADIFGTQVLSLLTEAKATLCDKYDFDLDHPIVVEMFPNQSDFGVRTFGMPHNPGFLGVCFGDVITANSPSSAIGHDSNWKAVLWHEFCHVITLNITQNKMPRWLSEGISVFEELEKDASWGQHMTPDYRQRILRDTMTPIASLSAAFLNASTGQDMQFAYFQSSLVVAYVVEAYGLDALKATLRDLGKGIPINEALSTHTTAVEELDRLFVNWAKERASRLGETLNWDEPDPAIIQGRPIEDLLAAMPDNYYHLTEALAQHVAEEDWQKAQDVAKFLLEAYPDQRGLDGALYQAAVIESALGNADQAYEHLKHLTRIDGDVADAYLRLMEMAMEKQDWEVCRWAAECYLAVNPLLGRAYEILLMANEGLHDNEAAIEAGKNVVKLNPLDPAKAHYRLARLLQPADLEEARTHVLLALEEAPRYREAQNLLLSIHQLTQPTAPRQEAASETSSPQAQ